MRFVLGQSTKDHILGVYYSLLSKLRGEILWGWGDQLIFKNLSPGRKSLSFCTLIASPRKNNPYQSSQGS